ncbi:hypothetical protein M0804_008276 [Polistes exclamans]|nr:hypothetical protein M0804_008276 [Polistes exclamans]
MVKRIRRRLDDGSKNRRSKRKRWVTGEERQVAKWKMDELGRNEFEEISRNLGNEIDYNDHDDDDNDDNDDDDYDDDDDDDINNNLTVNC